MWDFNHDLTSNKPPLYLLDYGDFKIALTMNMT